MIAMAVAVMAFFMHIDDYGLCSEKNRGLFSKLHKVYAVSGICYAVRRIGHILQDAYIPRAATDVFGSHGGFRKHPLFRGIQGGIRQKLHFS